MAHVVARCRICGNLNLANSHGNDGFNSNERSALQAFNNCRRAETQPDGLGYANEWPFGPKDDVNQDDVHIVHVMHVGEFPRATKRILHVMIIPRNENRRWDIGDHRTQQRRSQMPPRPQMSPLPAQGAIRSNSPAHRAGM